MRRLGTRRTTTPARLARLFVESLESRELLAAGASMGALDLGALRSDADQYDPSRILVRFQPGAAAPVLANTTVGEELPLVGGLREVHLSGGVTVFQALAAYRASPTVVFAEPDYNIRLTDIPNDTSFASLWGLHNTGQGGGTADADIDAAEAWNITLGSSSVVVAVIDSGVDYNHPDLAANVWVNTREIAGNGLDDDGNGYVDDRRGYDFANNDADPMDDNGHGTHVAGTIGALGNNALGVVGVARNVRLMPLKFLAANGSGSTSNAVRALDYAVANGASISNNSWGGGGFNQSLAAAIERARAAGHIFVAAAGNGGSDGVGDNNDATPNYPSNYTSDNVVAVAASDRNDRLGTFSNYGATTVDLAAPGVAILSTTPNNTYSTYSGTSMAAPHVSGVLALVRGQHPEWTYRQVIDQVLRTVDLKPAFTGKTLTGGRLNAASAVGPATPPADTSGARVTGAVPVFSGSAVVGLRLTFNEAVSDFAVNDVSSFTGPNGVNLLSQVTGVTGSGTTYTVSFSARTAAGSYSLTFGPGIRDAAGNLMNQNGNAVNGEATADRYTATFSVATPLTFSVAPRSAIRDYTTTVASITIAQDITISDLNARINITHTWDSDLVITLRGPDGTTVTLANRRGGSGDNFTDTTFDDQSTRTIATGAAPFAGSYKAEGSLAAFNGKNARGVWTLSVADVDRGDLGTLNSFALVITRGTATSGATTRSLGLTQLDQPGPGGVASGVDTRDALFLAALGSSPDRAAHFTNAPAAAQDDDGAPVQIDAQAATAAFAQAESPALGESHNHTPRHDDLGEAFGDPFSG